jgi:hypothetical protein
MDKLLLRGQNLGQLFNLRSGHLHAATFFGVISKTAQQLKTQPKQLQGSFPLVIALPEPKHVFRKVAFDYELNKLK